MNAGHEEDGPPPLEEDEAAVVREQAQGHEAKEEKEVKLQEDGDDGDETEEEEVVVLPAPRPLRGAVAMDAAEWARRNAEHNERRAGRRRPRAPEEAEAGSDLRVPEQAEAERPLRRRLANDFVNLIPDAPNQ